MVKRWLAIREKSIPVLRRSLIVSLSLTAVVGAVYLTKPLLWPGGVGIERGETVTTERVEKDAKGIPVKTTTKRDDGKTLWDWLSLLGVPLSLAILGFGLQLSQQKRAEKVAQEQRERDQKIVKEQREIAADETKEEVLQVYFDRLSALLVDKNLLAIASKVYSTEAQEAESQPKTEATLEERELLDSAVDVIRARTLSILRRFDNDPERKTSVTRFLIEADIVGKLKLSLSGANLSDANLNGANLNGANLINANLNDANFFGADLSDANLSIANLFDANLNDANLSIANLFGAKFRDNPGLSEADKAEMKKRGAIFQDILEVREWGEDGESGLYS
jgi:hypothetical protein